MLKLFIRNETYFIIVAAFFSALSGFLLKTGARRINGDSIFTFEAIFPYSLAVFSYGLGFIAYSLALRSSSVSQVYPAMVGVTILLIFSWNIFSEFETVTIRGSIGAVLVILGIYLVLSAVKK